MASDRNNQISKDVSNMIRQGFYSDSSIISSPSRTAPASRASPPPPPPLSPSSSSPSGNLHRLPAPPSSSPQIPSNSSPTLSQIMSEEQQREARDFSFSPFGDNQLEILKKIKEILSASLIEEHGRSDVKLVLVSRDCLRVPLNVHRWVLTAKSGYFREKLGSEEKMVHNVEISECDDIALYAEAIALMYCEDLKKTLMNVNVERVSKLLLVALDLKFEAAVSSCLQLLEATPWTEEEGDKVFSQLSELGGRADVAEVLQRLTSKPPISSQANDVILQVLNGVLQAKNDKSRQKMKTLISELLVEEETCPSNHNSKIDVSAEVLKQLCQICLTALIDSSKRLTSEDADAGAFKSEISRQADNLLWVVEILIVKDLGDDFVKQWGDQKELASLHPKIPQAHRFEMSRITAHLCTSMGKGLILVPRDTRYSLLSTWLEALYDDFRWMRSYCKNFDRKLVEEAISQLILTLSLVQQQGFLLNWFKRFVNKGDDCPNLQQAFEVWWRRAFLS